MEQADMAPPPPPPVRGIQDALSGDIDEAMELHQNVTPPPPPPPPPRRKKSGGSSRHERRTMMQTADTPFQNQQQREPLNSLASQEQQPAPPPPKPQQPEQYESMFAHEEKKECESSPTNHSSSMVKNKPPPRPALSKPPKQPGSKRAEYGSKLESFHMIMLENIEKETNLIRRSGSFQYHHNNMNNHKTDRKQQSSSDSDNRGTPTRKGNKSHQPTANNNNSSVVIEENNNVGSLLKETMNDISVAAAQTMGVLKKVIEQHTKDTGSGKKGVEIGGTVVPLPINVNCGKIDDSATAFGMEDDDDDESKGIVADPKEQATPPRKSSSGHHHARTNSGSDLMKKMNDGIRKLVVDATNAVKTQTTEGGKIDHRGRPIHDENENSGEAWGVGNLLANGFGWEDDYEEDEIASKATYDTWDEENSVLRRLGSWGTVNSQFTAGTAGTGATFGTMATYETESIVGPVSAAVAAAAAAKDGALDGQMAPPGSHHLRDSSDKTLKDDEGNPIDPALVEAAKKKQKKRKPRRKRVVKFDYPPIKSLRQYERPDVEDLPNLFFTEHELDQIEDDRYNTMSTDDIEIVAVASKESPRNEDEDDALDAKLAASSPKGKKKKNSKQEDQDEQYEKGYKPVKGRSGTPNRRRPSGGDSGSDKKKAPKSKQSPSKSDNEDNNEEERSSPRRLVKGVQIYLRERSTGT